MSYILFYSNYCKYSKKYIDILERSGEASFFTKICVDKDRRTGKRPDIVNKYGVKEVPTIIVDNKMLPGQNAFKWLHNRIENSHDKVNSVPTRQNKTNINIQKSQGYNTEEKMLNNESVEPYYSDGNFANNCVNLNALERNEEPSNFDITDDNITRGINIDNFEEQKNTSKIKKDTLKSKQIENDYNKLLAEREECAPLPPQRI